MSEIKKLKEEKRNIINPKNEKEKLYNEINNYEVFQYSNKDKIIDIMKKKKINLKELNDTVKKMIEMFDEEYNILTIVGEYEFAQIIIDLDFNEEHIREKINYILAE